jgi:GT2 family glycosyltransferase
VVLHITQGSDGTLDWARERGIGFTASRDNIGVCRALNAARTLAAGDYLVYMNDDMYACPGWVTALLKAAGEGGHNRFMLSGTLIEPRKTSNYAWWGGIRKDPGGF